MIRIDPQTGLPRLPDGYFWRVDTSGVQIRKIFVTPWSSYRRHETNYDMPWTVYKVETREVDTFRYGFFGRKIPYKRVEYRHVGSYMVEFKSVIIEPDSILEECQQLLEYWEQTEKRRALYGDYPPKKLDTE